MLDEIAEDAVDASKHSRGLGAADGSPQSGACPPHALWHPCS